MNSMTLKWLENKVAPLLSIRKYKEFSLDELKYAYILWLVLQENGIYLRKGANVSGIEGNVYSNAFYYIAHCYKTVSGICSPEYTILVYASSVMYFNVTYNKGNLNLKDVCNEHVLRNVITALIRASGEEEGHSRFISLPQIDASFAILYGYAEPNIPDEYNTVERKYWLYKVSYLLDGVSISPATIYLLNRQREPNMVKELLDEELRNQGINKMRLLKKDKECLADLLKKYGRVGLDE